MALPASIIDSMPKIASRFATMWKIDAIRTNWWGTQDGGGIGMPSGRREVDASRFRKIIDSKLGLEYQKIVFVKAVEHAPVESALKPFLLEVVAERKRPELSNKNRSYLP